MKRRAAIASALAACLSGCGRSPAPTALPSWPELPVTGLNGQPAVLPAVGQARIVNIWALWCAPCRIELPALERLGLALAPRGVQVSAIALADDVFAVREYLSERAARLAGAVLPPKHPLVRQFGIQALPRTFAVGRNGAVLASWVGAREWDAPQVRADVERVLAQA